MAQQGLRLSGLLLPLLGLFTATAATTIYRSAVGDPGMKARNPRVLLEAWNFCNRACAPGDQSCNPSPRYADCVSDARSGPGPNGNRVTDHDNALFNLTDPDDYAEWKERYLGMLCEEVQTDGQDSFFWTAMLKSGNYIDHPAGGICAIYHNGQSLPLSSSSSSSSPSLTPPYLPPHLHSSFNNLPMNQPLVKHVWSAPDIYGNWSGSMYGTWDLNSTFARMLSLSSRASFFSEQTSSSSSFSSSTPELGTKEQAIPCDLSGRWLRVNKGVVEAEQTVLVRDLGNHLVIQGGDKEKQEALYFKDGKLGQLLPLSSFSSSSSPSSSSSSSSSSRTASFLSGEVHGAACEAIAWREQDSPIPTWWCRPSFCGGDELKEGGGATTTTTAAPSYFELSWLTDPKNITRRIYHNGLRTSPSYPWLMLYFGGDAFKGLKGGYDWDGRGMIDPIPRSPDFIVSFFLNITEFTSSSSMYFLNMGGCWKMDGTACDGNATTDITRYALMDTGGPLLCSAKSQGSCPPYHTFLNGSIVYPNNTESFPYTAYKWYCSPDRCDHYSNPMRQEILKIAPHPEWAVHGFPSHPARSSFTNQPTYWRLQVGALTARLAFAGKPPAVRQWTTLNIGPEMGLDGSSEAVSMWDIGDFDVLVPE